MKGWLSTLRVRLILGYLLIILLGMGLSAALSWLAVESLYLETQRASLLAQAQVAAAALQGVQPPEYAPVYTQTTNLMPGIHTRVIDAQGAVVIDLSGVGSPAGGVELPQLAQNPAGLVTAEELLARPEIAAALAGEASTVERYVQAGDGGRVLYAAAPVLAADGSVMQIIYLATPLPDTQWAALPEGLRWQFIGLLVLGGLVTAGLGLLLARRISRPLGQLVQAAWAVAGGDLCQTVPQEGAIAELDKLGGAFNRMTEALRQSDQAKTAFISDVSHELRTPLTVIKGGIETLQDGALDDLEARGAFLDSMNRETERLIRLVNDLLVLTRADAGGLNLRGQMVDMVELARARCQALERLAEGKGVRLCPPEGSRAQVEADPDRLAQVLDNLLHNAIRYTPAGGAVRVGVSLEADWVICSVSDDGPGIPAEHLSHIFERFYRVEAARERDSGQTGAAGSGLGLAIVRSLVLAHGGAVSASSPPGEGATILFKLPIKSNL